MTTGTGKAKGKRGRRRKTEDVSVVSGGKATAADGASVTGQGGDEAAEEDDDDGEGEEGVVGEKEKRQKEKEAADLAYVESSHCLQFEGKRTHLLEAY